MINKTFAKYVRDLMAVSETLIKLGRVNFERKDFETDYIVIDSLTGDIPLASSSSFDSVDESMEYTSLIKKAFVVDFYGENAYANASKFQLLVRSQKSSELQDTYKISVYRVTTVTDVKALTGQQYGNRVQCELMVQFNNSIEVDTLRIDVAQIEIRNEEKIIWQTSIM